LGDAIMAAFPKSPDDAIYCTRDLLKELDSVNWIRKQKGEKKIQIGIGINSGKAMLGIIGEEDRLEAAVMSDAVNLAARLESLTKFYGNSAIISKAVLDNLKNKVNSENVYRKLDVVKVKGKNIPVTIYELLIEENDTTKLKLKLKKDYEDALSFYIDGEILKAYNIFTNIVKHNPDDKAAVLFQNRCIPHLLFNDKNEITGQKILTNWVGITSIHQK
jgi:hypothetical protein